MKILSLLAGLFFSALLGAQEIPDDFISFSVPGYEKQMEQIRAIYYEAYMNPAARPGPSFWDVWTPVPLMSVAPLKADMDSLWIHTMLTRHIDRHGYVSSHQHFSHALDSGWPFPLFPQLQEGFEGATFGYLFQDSPEDVTGMLSGWRGLLYDKGYMGDRAAGRWTLKGLRSGGIVNDAWELTVTDESPSIETEAGFLIDAFCCPFISFRAEWDTDAPMQGVMEWCREGEDRLGGKAQRVLFDMQQPDPFHGTHVRYCTLEPYLEKAWTGKITKLRFTFPNAPGSKIRLHAIFSAFDTRHQMNACNFLIGSIHTFNQTGDEAFLRGNIERMRRVFSYAQEELYDRKAGMIRVRYPGHDGLPGFVRDSAGRKVYQYGHSIGGNYWDILPFGNLETYTSYYYVYMLRMMADLEEYIRSNEALGVPSGGRRLHPRALRREADRIAATLNRRLWNERTGRFYASEDVEGNKWDYGFTFLNEEAIYYGAVSPEHARSIMEWIDGRRIVEGDTSTGEDIYHWRLAPRATTRRNESWYYWGWEPDVFPYGRQVQDGGAVFSQSFNDMMSRIRVYGPDNAWKRFEGILDWYADTRAAGGYRAYYASGEHGNSMQGMGTAGGIGIDMEFAETLLVPYTMVEGFLGFKATPEGFAIEPHLPSEWKSLTVNNLRFRGQLLSITADASGITVRTEGKPLCGVVALPDGYTSASGRPLGGGRWAVAPAAGEAWATEYRFSRIRK